MTTTSIRQQILDRLSPGGPDRFWTVRDFSDLGADPQSVDRALLRLVDDGELRRVRRGLYWRGRRSRFGMMWPDDLTLARRIADVPGVGPAGLLAANVLGLSTQVPGVPSFAVPRRAPRSPASFRFVDRAGRRGRVTQRLNPVEVAVLEVLGDWDRVVELPRDRAVALLCQQAADGAVRPDRLALSASSEPTSVRAGLDNVFGTELEQGRSGRVRSLVDT